MQIKKTNNQPSFKGMHIIQLMPKSVPLGPKVKPAQIAELTQVASGHLEDVYTPFSKIVPESAISVKNPAKTFFGLNFTEGLEGYEETFMAFVANVKSKFPDQLIKHTMIEHTNDSLVEKIAKETAEHPPIGFHIANTNLPPKKH